MGKNHKNTIRKLIKSVEIQQVNSVGEGLTIIENLYKKFSQQFKSKPTFALSYGQRGDANSPIRLVCAQQFEDTNPEQFSWVVSCNPLSE
jgi:hypothetical protein